ncbi:TrmH family RNA methyltransferase [Candidatus Saccharibacteria bacterium]|nr:TrmH family RNA methyltransferase [Candidatus Saccharibacteria bacterium]
MQSIILIAHNLRSCHNVGSLLRTAEGLGINKVFLTGYTPYPLRSDDTRMPHMANKLDFQIHKTALGAEKLVDWVYDENISNVINSLKSEGYQIAALEQTNNSVALPTFNPSDKIALILGREVEGMEADVLKQCAVVLEIPMAGKKESFNVVQAAAMALYQFKYG